MTNDEWESKTCIMSTLNKWRIMFALIFYDIGTCFYMRKKTSKFSKFMYKIHGQLWGDDNHQLTHLNIHIDCSWNVSLKITKIQNFISSLGFKPDLHQLFTVLKKARSAPGIWINLNLDRLSRFINIWMFSHRLYLVQGRITFVLFSVSLIKQF